MKTFELSDKVSKDGRRHFKVILHEIYDNSCVDEINGVGKVYNKNGITWIREYCEWALPSIAGMSIRCEFLDEDRTILYGHGETDTKDGLPVFENAVMIGQFEGGYITEIETEDGVKTVCVGEGTIDGLCYHNFCEKLEEQIENGDAPNGSVEILKTDDNPSIIYKYGYKDLGRIPMIFKYSGFALLGKEPADQTSKILELNNDVNETVEDTDKEETTMDENVIKAIVSQAVSEMNSANEEISKIKAECEAKIAEHQNAVAELQEQVNELNNKITELETNNNTLGETNATLVSEKEALVNEINELKANLEDAQKKEKMGELNEAIKEFTDEQKAYAQTEIDAFNESPLTSEINSVVNKIHAEIGKKYMEEMAKKANEVHDEPEVEDIFSEINEKKASEEDVDIF